GDLFAVDKPHDARSFLFGRSSPLPNGTTRRPNRVISPLVTAGTLETEVKLRTGTHMATGRRTTPGGRLRGNGALPVVAGLAAALTLSGAAVYTVESMPCDNAGQYVRHANSTELIGGCVNGGR